MLICQVCTRSEYCTYLTRVTHRHVQSNVSIPRAKSCTRCVWRTLGADFPGIHQTFTWSESESATIIENGTCWASLLIGIVWQSSSFLKYHGTMFWPEAIWTGYQLPHVCFNHKTRKYMFCMKPPKCGHMQKRVSFSEQYSCGIRTHQLAEIC